MSYLYAALAILGPGRTGLTGTIGLRVLDASTNTVLVAFSTAGVTETAVKGDYKNPGVVLPDNTRVQLQWGDNTTWMAEEVVDPRTLNTLGSGQYAITVTVAQTPSGVVPGALVTVQNSGQTANVAYGMTGEDGTIAFSLSPGTYKVLVSAGPAFTTLAVQTLVVTATASVTYTLTPQSPTPPAVPGLCTVQVFVRLNGALADGYVVNATLETGNYCSGVLLSNQVDKAITGASPFSSGYAELQLVRKDQFTRGSKFYNITVATAAGAVVEKRRVQIPNVDSVNFEDMVG